MQFFFVIAYKGTIIDPIIYAFYLNQIISLLIHERLVQYSQVNQVKYFLTDGQGHI